MIRPPPPGVKTVAAVGPDVARAVRQAAEQLGTEPEAVQWTVDRDWFRSDIGTVMARDQVRILAWVRDPEEVRAATEARAWLEGLLERMGLEGSVRARVQEDGAVELVVQLPQGAGRFVGRRGATLQAVKHLLLQSVGADHPDRTFRIDVQGEKDAGREADGRSRRPEGAGRGEERSSRRIDKRKLRRLADRVAERVLKRGRPEVIRRELTALERRVVHLRIAEKEGLGTRSIGEGPVKRIEVFPLRAAEDEE